MDEGLIFPVGFDVSNALSGQEKLIQGFKNVAEQGALVAKALDTAKAPVEAIKNALNNLDPKSIGSIVAQFAILQNTIDNIRSKDYWIAQFTGGASSALKQLSKEMVSLGNAYEGITGRVRSLATMKFTNPTMASHLQELKTLKNEYAILKQSKDLFNKTDFKLMTNDYKRQIEEITNSIKAMKATASFTTQKRIEKRDAENRAVIEAQLAQEKQELLLKRQPTPWQGRNSEISKFLAEQKKVRSEILAELGNSKTPYTAKELAVGAKGEFARAMYGDSGLFGSSANKLFPPIQQPKTSLDVSATSEQNRIRIEKEQKAFAELAKAQEAAAKSAKANKISPLPDGEERKVNRVTRAYSAFGRVFKRVFEYSMIYKFQNALLSLPGIIFDINVAMEKLEATYRGTYGEEGNDRLNYSKMLSNRYGKDYTSIGDSYRKFSVTTSELGVSAKENNLIFEATTEALTKAGSTSEDVGNAFRALIQMYSKGVITGEEFTRQLSQYIPAANAMAAASIGKTTAEFKQLLNTGKLIPEEFIPNFMKQLKIFGIGWEETANSLESTVQRMKNSFIDAFNSAAFQDTAKDVLSSLNTIVKGFSEAAVAVYLVKTGHLSPLEYLFGSDAEIHAKIEQYNKNMATYESKIAYYKERLAALNKPTIESAFSKLASFVASPATGLMDAVYGTSERADLEGKLGEAQSGLWIQQLRGQQKSAALEFDRLKKLYDGGDISVTAELKYNREAILWAEDQLAKLNALNGSSILMTLDVNIDSVWTAMQSIDRLWAKTKQGQAELAKTEYDLQSKKLKEIEGSLAENMKRNDETSRRMIPKQIEAVRKGKIELEEAQGSYYLAAQAASRRDNVQPYGPFKKLSSGNPKKDQIDQERGALEESLKHLASVHEILMANEKDEKKRAELQKQHDARVENEKAYTQGRINNINKQGSGGAGSAARHANAVEKLNESLENTLKKEYALAEENPLEAAFAAADEKCNNLMTRVKDLAIKGGVDIETATKRIEEFRDAAKDVAVGKELENIFPWMKKDNKVLAGWQMLTSEWERTKKKFAEHGMGEDEGFAMLEDQVRRIVPMLEKMAELKSRIETAKDFGTFASLKQQQEDLANSASGENTISFMQEMYDKWQLMSKGMSDSRVAMYQRVAEEAKAYGADATFVENMVASAMEETKKKQLEAIQTYGTASQAFQARLTENYGGYKSSATKAREEAIELADSIKESTDSFADGAGSIFGDLIRNFGNGTASFENMWKSMLNRMLDMLASFVEKAITKWIKKLFSSFFGDENDSAQGFGSYLTANLPSVNSSYSGSGFDFSGFLTNAISKSSSSSKANSSLDLLTGSTGTLLSGSKSIWDVVSSNAGKSATEGLNPFFSNALNESSKVVEAASGAAGVAATAASTASAWIPVVGAVVAVGGALLSGLFNNDKKKQPQKLYDGTQSIVSNGVAGALSYEVMDDGSMKAKALQPKDIQEVQKAFKDLVKSVNNAAKVLEIDLVENFDTTFTMITGVITDELKDTADWVMQSALGQHALGDLSGAVQYFSDGMQNMVEIFTGLADSIKNVKGHIEALGINFAKFSGISDSLLNQVAEFATSQYTVMQDIAKDAASGDAGSIIETITKTSYSLNDLGDSATDAATYLAKYKDQITSLAEASVSSMYEDALGGSDSFTSAMETYAKYAITTKEEKSSAIDYYTSKLTTLLNKFQTKFSDVLVNFGTAGISADNVDSFWSAYNAAMQQTMSPKMLAAWAEMASYASLIEEASTELEKVNQDAWTFAQDLKARDLATSGKEKEAEITRTLTGYESELFEARQNGRTYTEQAALVQTQVNELQKKLNDALGITVDATSSYDEALKELTKSISNQIEALSDIASSSNTLVSTYTSIADGLKDLIETVQEDSFENTSQMLAARLYEFNQYYTKGIAGDTEALEKMASAGNKVWESLKQKGLSFEEYDYAKASLISLSSTAQQYASTKKDYNEVIAGLSQQQVDILNAIKDELADDTIDTAFIATANKLEQVITTFSTAYDKYQRGNISYGDMLTAATGSQSSITSWISELMKSATISTDQFGSIGGLSSSFVNTYRDQNSVSASLLEANIGTNSFLKQLMNGTFELTGLSQQQAVTLGSALASLETITKLTGDQLTYSDTAKYYLSKVADGTSIENWSKLIEAITNGNAGLISILQQGIADLTAKQAELVALASAQSKTTADQAAYFQQIYGLLYKQTQIELYTGLISNAQSTATGYLNYAVMAGAMGSTIAAVSWLGQYQQVQTEIDSLKQQLAYWNAYMPTVAAASGVIVTRPTSIYAGEGGEPEGVFPLSDLSRFIGEQNNTAAFNMMARELSEIKKELVQINENTSEVSDNTSTAKRRGTRT